MLRVPTTCTNVASGKSIKMCHQKPLQQMEIPNNTRKLPRTRRRGDLISSLRKTYPVMAVKINVSALHIGAAFDIGSFDNNK